MRSPGVGVFETMRVRRGAIPLLSRHLARLGRSLSALGLPAADRDLDSFVVPVPGLVEAVLPREVRDGRAADRGAGVRRGAAAGGRGGEGGGGALAAGDAGGSQSVPGERGAGGGAVGAARRRAGAAGPADSRDCSSLLA